MRLGLGVLVLAAACGFPGNDATPTADGPVADPTDGPPGAIDAAADAPVIDATPPPDGAWCRLDTAPGTDEVRGRVGGAGGDPRPDVLCDATTDVIIGIAIELSNGTTLFNGLSARGIRIACAPVTVIGGGAPVLGSEYTREVRGNGNEGWSPSTWSGVSHCPAGSVVSGLQVHTGSGNNDNRFIDVNMQCKELAADGTATGTPTSLYVGGSGNENNGSETVNCAAGDVLRVLQPFAGSGLDSVGLVCAQPRCAP